MSQDITSMLGAAYGTLEPQGEDLEKEAQIELFAKLAADEGIDLESMTESEVEQLWDATFTKSAADDSEEEEDEDDEDEEKKMAAAAQAEYEAQRADQEKIAEADFMGRVMAHSMMAEINKVASLNGEDPTEQYDDMAKEALSRAQASQAVKNWGQYAKHLGGQAKGKARDAGAAAAKAGRSAGAWAKESPGSHYSKMRRAAQAAKRTEKGWARAGAKPSSNAAAFIKDKKREALREGASLAAKGTGAAAGLAGVGALGYQAGKKKQSSANLDVLAAYAALDKVAAAGWDVDEAAQRLDALLTLGPAESEKTASAETFEDAVEARSLELLEQGGYPVEWEG